MKRQETKTENKKSTIHIPPIELPQIRIPIVGDSYYVQHKFSAKARLAIMEKQEQGAQAQKGKKRAARDFGKEYKEAMHISEQGWNGIPVMAFKGAMVDVCRMVGYKMTLAKQSFFVKGDGFDREEEGTELVKIIKGEPTRQDRTVRLETGVCSVVARPFWPIGWEATVTVEYDGDQFTAEDVVNLLNRAGRQVGIGEGRAFSKNSCGCGWGSFRVKEGKK